MSDTFYDQLLSDLKVKERELIGELMRVQLLRRRIENLKTQNEDASLRPRPLVF